MIGTVCLLWTILCIWSNIIALNASEPLNVTAIQSFNALAKAKTKPGEGCSLARSVRHKVGHDETRNIAEHGLINGSSVRGFGVCDGPLQHLDAIIILGQKKHSTYDSSHSTSLEPILWSLSGYYPAVHQADVLVWHEGDLSRDDIPPDLITMCTCAI
jgi:hypothetical protein